TRRHVRARCARARSANRASLPTETTGVRRGATTTGTPAGPTALRGSAAPTTPRGSAGDGAVRGEPAEGAVPRADASVALREGSARRGTAGRAAAPVAPCVGLGLDAAFFV